jgi:hypothetical protein
VVKWHAIPPTKPVEDFNPKHLSPKMNSLRICRILLMALVAILETTVAHAESLGPVVVVPIIGVFNSDRMPQGEVVPAVFIQIERQQNQEPLRVILKHRPGMVDLNYQDQLEAALLNGLKTLNYEAKGLTVCIGFSGLFRFTGESLSGAIVIGTVAALEGRTLAPNLVLTGSVGPDGSLGPIGDLDAKIAGAGSYTVLYPSSQIVRASYHGASQPVRTLQEARLLMLP